MMGTVWLRLDTEQENIQPFINAIVRLLRLTPFFLTAYSFMALAVLRIGLHVIYGGCLCPRILRRPSDIRKGAC